MPAELSSYNARLTISAACVSNQVNSPAPNLIIISVSLDDGSPFTGLTIKDFVLVTYNIDDGRPNKVNIKSAIELRDELAGIDFQGVYKLEPKSEDVFREIKIGQTVYAIKVSRTISTPVQIRYSGQAVVSSVMLKPL